MDRTAVLNEKKNKIRFLLQMRGHKLAQLDPLGLSSADLDAERPNDLTFKFYNFSKISIRLQSQSGKGGLRERIDSRLLSS